MARKRKLEPRSTEASEPSKKQQQQQQQEEIQKVFEEPKPPIEPEEEVVEEEEQEEEEVEEEEYEEYKEEEDEDEEDESEDDEEAIDVITENAKQTAKTSVSGADQSGGVADDDDEEPIEALLEPFSKDQVVNLLREAADKHQDISDRIRKVADEDPVHRKIFVHGLGWDTNAEALANAFKQYGEIEDCKAVCDKVSGKSKGYGFILFKSRAGARRALKQPQKKIGNRTTACQLSYVGPVPPPNASASSAAPASQTQGSSSEYTQRKIYVSNVGAELDPQKLYTFFAKFGEIEEGPLGIDKMTGKPRGFCLFVYRTVEAAKVALEEPHKNFEGHILHCQRAIDGPKPRKSQHQNQHHHHNNSQSNQFQRNGNPGFVAGPATAPGHLMAPAGPGMGFNQGPAAAQALNPALGQAITALLATQGGLGLTNLLGTFGSTGAVNPNVPVAAHGMQGAYGSQATISPGVMGGHGNQGGIPGGYPNQQMAPGGSGRGQHGVGQFGSGPTYMGH